MCDLLQEALGEVYMRSACFIGWRQHHCAHQQDLPDDLIQPYVDTMVVPQRSDEWWLMQRLDMVESNMNADEKEIQTLHATLEAYKQSTRPTSSVNLMLAVIQPYVDTTVLPQMCDTLQEALEDVYTRSTCPIGWQQHHCADVRDL